MIHHQKSLLNCKGKEQWYQNKATRHSVICTLNTNPIVQTNSWPLIPLWVNPVVKSSIMIEHNYIIYIYTSIYVWAYKYGSKPIILYFVFVNIQLPDFSVLTRVHSYKSKLGVYLFTGCDCNCIWGHKSRLIIQECSNIYVIIYVAVQRYIVLYGGVRKLGVHQIIQHWTV